MAALANEAARSENKARFEMDLEFVQSLGNTQYLYQLAHQGILDDAAFVNYLKYLLCESALQRLGLLLIIVMQLSQTFARPNFLSQ